jgi:hypothetical protein
MKNNPLGTAFVVSCFMFQSAFAFEGRIMATVTRGGQATPLLYTAGINSLRVEVTTTNRPYPVNLLNLSSGEMTLVFPGNRSFVHLKAAAENDSSAPPGFPAMPPGVGPQSQPMAAPPSIGPTNFPGMPAPPAMPNMPAGGGMPAMPMMSPMMGMMQAMELTATGDKTNLLGQACEKFQIKQRGETMDIWATAQLFPFQPYLQNQPHRIGSQRIEEKWGGLLAEKKLFPLLAVLRYERSSAPGAPPVIGAERYRFEVQAITPEKITPDDDAKLFQPPPNYQELRPLPF